MKHSHILVTGAAGYIGSTLVRLLLHKKYRVTGLDILSFGSESIDELLPHQAFSFIHGDVCDPAVVEKAVSECDAVVHLAAIVGDPACAREPDRATAINWNATKALYDYCRETDNVKAFIFASTCSNYGKMQGSGYVNEESPLQPVSLYAELKVKCEEYLLNSTTRSDFIPTSLRFATVYGLSHRMRFDLTVNEFIKDAFRKKELTIYGEQFWRPYCYVSDVARACLCVLESEKDKVDHQVFGVGDTEENYQKKMLAEEIVKMLPDTTINYVHKDEDPRDYRVDFSKIRQSLGYSITRTVPAGMQEILNSLKTPLFNNPDDGKYYNS